MIRTISNGVVVHSWGRCPERPIYSRGTFDGAVNISGQNFPHSCLCRVAHDPEACSCAWCGSRDVSPNYPN